MLKAVIDTNILVSAVLSKNGTPAKILEFWRKRSFLLAINEAAMQEAQRVLNDLGSTGKYNLPSNEISELLQLLRKEAQFVPGQIQKYSHSHTAPIS